MMTKSRQLSFFSKSNKPSKQHHEGCYTVSYNSGSHWSVLTQRWGSVWPQVFPYCVLNVFMLILLKYVVPQSFLRNIEVTAQAHQFLTMVVSFLLVSRVNIALNRYDSVRDSLSMIHREARELVQNMCVLSSHNRTEYAKKWRNQVAYRSLLLLRTTTAVLNYRTSRIPAWDVPELNGEEYDDIQKSILTNGHNHKYKSSNIQGLWQETMRVPVRMAYLLRKSIHSQSQEDGSSSIISNNNNPEQQEPIMSFGAECKLLASVDGFMNGYYGIRKFLTTPVPFPLIQMGRTFMFLFVFTVPFVMLSDQSNIVAHSFAVFLLTYGFVGLETVAIELDDPFGNDDNDFDAMALVLTALEDTYLTVLDVDGTEWTDKLRERIGSSQQSPSSLSSNDCTSSMSYQNSFDGDNDDDEQQRESSLLLQKV